MKHVAEGSCVCGVCIAREFQRKRKGHPYFKGNAVWVRAFRSWRKGTVVKIGPKKVHVRFFIDGTEHVKAVDATIDSPEILPFETAQEMLA